MPGGTDWGLARLHLNASARLGHDAGRPLAGAPPRWALSLAADPTFYRRSLLLVAELGLPDAASDAPTEVSAALGARCQLTPTLVPDGGLRRRLTADTGPDLGLSLGVSHAFGVAGWMPGGAR